MQRSSTQHGSPTSRQDPSTAASAQDKSKLSFLFGSQYYRAPTPEPECWAEDLAKMKDIGFNQVKYWVQWRWQHRAPDRFYWDDLDCLMDLAGNNGIGVT